MSHRTVKTLPRLDPHDWIDTPGDPLTCARCSLIRQNEAHDPARIAAHQADQAAREERLHQQQQAVAGRYNPEED